MGDEVNGEIRQMKMAPSAARLALTAWYYNEHEGEHDLKMAWKADPGGGLLRHKTYAHAQRSAYLEDKARAAVNQATVTLVMDLTKWDSETTNWRCQDLIVDATES